MISALRGAAHTTEQRGRDRQTPDTLALSWGLFTFWIQTYMVQEE